MMQRRAFISLALAADLVGRWLDAGPAGERNPGKRLAALSGRPGADLRVLPLAA